MKIEVFHFDRCPNVTPTIERLKRILAESDLNHSIILVKVADRTEAQSIGFLGSPSVHINGVDLEPSARLRNDFGLMCRRYDGEGTPSETIILRAIAEANSGG